MDDSRCCNTCGRKPVSLRRCSGCQSVQYCSKACQRVDWDKGHKQRCKTISGKENNCTDIPKAKTKTNSKDIVGSPILSQTTSATTADSQQVKTPPVRKPCSVCGTRQKETKSCAACKTVVYCSKKCQKFDWPSHKLVCQDEAVDDVITTEGFERETKATTSVPRKHSLFNRQMMSPFAFHLSGETADTKTRVQCKPNTFGKATELAKKYFPRHKILDDIDEIPNELWGVRSVSTGEVVVAFIPRYHHYVGRHCVYIEDKHGQEIYVAFYFDFDTPAPFFRWEDIVPGKFICIRDPFIHYFTDGSVGIRVDLPSNVKLFRL